MSIIIVICLFIEAMSGRFSKWNIDHNSVRFVSSFLHTLNDSRHQSQHHQRSFHKQNCLVTNIEIPHMHHSTSAVLHHVMTSEHPLFFIYLSIYLMDMTLCMNESTRSTFLFKKALTGTESNPKVVLSTCMQCMLFSKSSYLFHLCYLKDTHRTLLK